MTAGAPMLTALAATAMAAAPAASPAFAQDCSIGRDGWEDIRRFRDCIAERGLEASSPWVLHRAARHTGNPTIVRLLLQAGADPNAPDDNGWSPLHHGAGNINPTVVSHLLNAGAEVNASDNNGYTALHWAAAKSGNGHVIKVLLDRGANPAGESNDGRTPLHSALRYRAEPSVVSAMLEAGGGEHLTPLQLSVLQGDANGRRSSSRRGCRSEPALHVAASQAPESVVSALLAAGSDPNAREAVAGWSPLHYAARYQEESVLTVITVLLRAGADSGSSPVSSDDNGLSPVHLALMNPEMTAPVIRALLEPGRPARRGCRGEYEE